MNQLRYLILFFILIIFNSCAKEKKEVSNIKEINQDQEMITAYQEAYEALELNDPYFAAKKFLEAELLFPQSKWAPRSALMAAYSYYMQHYLIAMCYYETIEDEKRDTKPLLKAKTQFELVLNEYPNTDFAMDAQFKIELIQDILASKEMYLGRHYIKRGKWIAAINRFKNIVENYDQTIFVEEAIHRLVEINYRIGLVDESQKYANLLGYNYGSSEWYRKSYKIFNKNYDLKITEIKKEKKGIFKKFKKLFD
jgi:outer membrane protein assembly factor BamD